MSNLSNNELLKMLKEKTKENIKTLIEKEMIYKDEQLTKNYSVNISMEYTNNSVKKPIPINIIYHTLYDQETNCQSSNGKQSFQRHIFSGNKDYDIKFDKKTLDNNSAPNFFKMKIEESCKNFIESNNSIKDKIDDLDNYPKIFEFQYIENFKNEKDDHYIYIFIIHINRNFNGKKGEKIYALPDINP